MKAYSTVLKNFKRSTPLIDRVEIYRRLWMFPRHFLSLFDEGVEQKAASDALSQLIQTAFRLNQDYPVLIADSLEGKTTLPAFMIEHEEEWMKSVTYLVKGDSEFDRAIDPSVYEYSRSIALQDIKSDLDKLVKRESLIGK